MSGSGRRQLRPLPDELSGPVREFTEELRAVYRDRTELNQRGLAEALHLTKSPVSRYLNGREVVPADTFAALCDIAGLTPRERERLGRLRQEAAEAAERARRTGQGEPGERTAAADPHGDARADTTGTGPEEAPGGTADSHGRTDGPSPVPSPVLGSVPNSTTGQGHSAHARQSQGVRTGTRLRSPAVLAALAAAVAVCAGAFAVVESQSPAGRPADADVTADEPGDGRGDRPRSGPTCRTTRVYRVIEDGDILDADRNDVGDVHADDVFRLDEAPEHSPYRYRDYGHVDGTSTKGWVDQAKLKALGSRCVDGDS